MTLTDASVGVILVLICVYVYAYTHIHIRIQRTSYAMVTIHNIITTQNKTYGSIEFLAEFKQWGEQPQRVFLNRLRENPSFDFELSTYTFSTTDYLKFKEDYNLNYIK